jgi:hypothetical protein
MAELKTKQTEASVEEYFDTIEDPRRRADCAAISALMKRVTKFEPKMWGQASLALAATTTGTRLGTKATHASPGSRLEGQRLLSTSQMVLNLARNSCSRLESTGRARSASTSRGSQT